MAQNKKISWWLTVAKWQDQRWLWILGGLIALSFELVAVYYFQEYLGERPCEMCVYIRFAMMAIFIFAMITAIYPSNVIFKLFGYFSIFWAITKGFLWSWNLERIIIERASPDFNPFNAKCSVYSTDYPFGLPLQKWLPSHFQQTAVCGEDLSLVFGLNMAEWTLIAFSAFALVVGLMLICWLCRWFKQARSNL